MASSSLPPLTHHITTKSSDGKLSFHDALNPPPAVKNRPTTTVNYIYSTAESFSSSSNIDLERHQDALKTKPLPSFPGAGGSSCHVLDFDPNPNSDQGFIHRTNTIEYCFLLEGELELSLAGGDKRVIRQGEIVVQRGCMHAWKNVSATKAARLAAVSIGGLNAVEREVETPEGKKPM